MTAIFCGRFAGAAAAGAMPWAASQSAAKRSRLPMATACCLPLTTQSSSDWLSRGQTRPRGAGRRLRRFIARAAAAKSPAAMSAMNSRMGTLTGQPSSQTGSWHCRQRSASAMAWADVYPSATSSQLVRRASLGRTGIFVLVGLMIGMPRLPSPGGAGQTGRRLLLVHVGLRAHHELGEVDFVGVEEGAVDAGKAQLAVDGDATGAAHAGAVDHDRVEGGDRLQAVRPRRLGAGAHHRPRADGKAGGEAGAGCQ